MIPTPVTTELVSLGVATESQDLESVTESELLKEEIVKIQAVMIDLVQRLEALESREDGFLKRKKSGGKS